MRTTATTAVLIVGLMLAGCPDSDEPSKDATTTGNGDTSRRDTETPDEDTSTSPDTTAEDSATPDADATSSSEPPEFRDISVAIQGEFSSQVDLTNGDARRILPVPAEAEFTVFATDDATDAKDLEVEAVREDGTALSTTESSFRNGLWRFTVELAPGMTVGVDVTDGDGETTQSTNHLTIPTREEALVDTWEKRFFSNGERNIVEQYELQLRDDGTWKEIRSNSSRGGAYEVRDDAFVLQRTYVEGTSGGDTDRDTVESDVAGGFYVDETYFSMHPWSRQGSGIGVSGTWSYSYKTYSHSGGQRELATEVDETLTLQENANSDNTWELERTIRTQTGEGVNETTHTASGTYEVVENMSYAGNYGDYLVRTRTHEDGQQLSTPETETELVRQRLDKLLVSPYLRNPDRGNN